jgi:hypothetical protein
MYEGALTTDLDSNEQATERLDMKVLQVLFSMQYKCLKIGATCSKKSRPSKGNSFYNRKKWLLYELLWDIGPTCKKTL